MQEEWIVLLAKSGVWLSQEGKATRRKGERGVWASESEASQALLGYPLARPGSRVIQVAGRDPVKAYLAAIGARGGQKGGPAKARGTIAMHLAKGHKVKEEVLTNARPVSPAWSKSQNAEGRK